MRRGADSDGFDLAAAQLQSMLASWVWEQTGPTAWRAATMRPEPLSLELAAESPLLWAHVGLVDIAVPASSIPDLAVFCAAANRFFAGWNLFLDGPPDNTRVVSAATFRAATSWGVLPASLIVAHAVTAVRAAAAAAPALREVIGGLDPRDALAVADRHDDALSWGEMCG